MIHARKDYNRIQDPENLIPENEPVFLIRGKDMVGPDAVIAWADLAESMGADQNIVRHAREHAHAMRVYQKTAGYKIPDMPQDA